MKILLILLVIPALIMGCRPVVPAPSPEPPLVSHAYIPSDDPILNPERGFFSPIELPGAVDFGSLRYEGYTLVHLNIHLDKWRETDIPPDVLADLESNFADLRDAGLKAIIRFSYNQGPALEPEPDATKVQILRHIKQLTPLLQQNADVIAWVEAGFIGAWGEWHNSTNGLDNIPDKMEILSALLKAMPDTRTVQLRYPYDMRRMFATPAEAIKARVGYHNDCFLSSETDMGTYEHDGQVTLESDLTYLSELTLFTPTSGETCALNPPRSGCTVALQEMALLHFSALNAGYNKDVLETWKDDGCLEEIDQRLGYRLSLVSAGFNDRARPGEAIRLVVNLQNSGFAAPVNRRPLYAVLRNREKNMLYKVKLDVDPHTWKPGIATFTTQLQVPPNAPEGMYQLALWLPDEFPSIGDNPHYAIQFANRDVWEKETGLNVLGTVTISNGVPGVSQNENEFRSLDIYSTTGTQ